MLDLMHPGQLGCTHSYNCRQPVLSLRHQIHHRGTVTPSTANNTHLNEIDCSLLTAQLDRSSKWNSQLHTSLSTQHPHP